MHCALITFADESDPARARGDRAVYVHGAEHAQRVDRAPLSRPGAARVDRGCGGVPGGRRGDGAQPVLGAPLHRLGAQARHPAGSFLSAHGGHALFGGRVGTGGRLHRRFPGGGCHHGGARPLLRSGRRGDPSDRPSTRRRGHPGRGFARARHVRILRRDQPVRHGGFPRLVGAGRVVDFRARARDPDLRPRRAGNRPHLAAPRRSIHPHKEAPTPPDR